MKNRFQILALDGGGIKGLFSAGILAYLEQDLCCRITDHFDLITGTSTGGIIALGLGSGIKPEDILQFYVENGPKIFPETRLRKIRHYWHRKYDSRNLCNALKECFGEKLLGDSRNRLVIPSYNMGDDDVYLFKTSHNSRLTRDYKVPMWKVAMATSAAPTYFPSCDLIDSLRLIDGGIWANNPTMIGIVEALSLMNVPLDTISIFSLGTTDEVKNRPNSLDNGGLWQWKKTGIDMALRGQSLGAVKQAQLLLGEDRVLRLDPKVPDELFDLDRLSFKELMGKAAHESRHIAPGFKKMFMDHVASEFIPYHQISKEKTHA